MHSDVESVRHLVALKVKRLKLKRDKRLKFFLQTSLYALLNAKMKLDK